MLKIYTESRSDWTSDWKSDALSIAECRTHSGWRMSDTQAVGHGQSILGKHHRIHALFPYPPLDTHVSVQERRGGLLAKASRAALTKLSKSPSQLTSYTPELGRDMSAGCTCPAAPSPSF